MLQFSLPINKMVKGTGGSKFIYSATVSIFLKRKKIILFLPEADATRCRKLGKCFDCKSGFLVRHFPAMLLPLLLFLTQ